MTWVIGILGAGILFGVLALVQPKGASCGSPCGGCTGDGACRARGMPRLDGEDIGS